MKRNATAARFLGALLVLVGLVLLQTAVHADDSQRGTWTADWQSNNRAVNLQMSTERKHNTFGQSYEVSQFKGLSADAINGPKAPIRFQLVRDAGTIDFDGFFDRGMGAGQFTFTPDATYSGKMQQLGFNCVGKKQFDMAALDISLAYAREYKDLGFTQSCDDLFKGAIFKVNRAQVEELRGLGYNNLSLEELVKLRIFKVDGAYIREMRAQGMDLSLDKLVETQIFKATPEFKHEMAELGYKDLSQEDLIAFKIHGVTPEYVRDMRALGFNDLSAKKLIEFRIFGVGRQQIEDLKAVGYTGVGANDLVAFKSHGVNADFIRKVQKYGYKHPSPARLVEMKIMGIRVRDNDRDNDRDDDSTL